jgi:hypothetical protein
MKRLALVAFLLLPLLSCKEAAKASLRIPARPAAAQGSVVVVGTLQALPSPFPANDLYQYAYVMKYTVDSVVEGKVEAREILVAHFDPRTPRAKVADDRKSTVGGSLESFQPGDRHYLVLRPLDSAWTGAIEDNYPQDKSPRWWASWADRI